MTGDEIVVIEWMNERSVRARKLAFIERFPGDIVWTREKAWHRDARIRSIFACGAVSITTTLHGTPASRAA